MAATRTVILALAAAERARPELEQIREITVIDRYELSSAREDDVLVRGLDRAWAVVAGSEPYTRGVLEALPELKAILRWGTGSDSIDIPAATDAGVAVVTTPAVNAEAVADMALALMLAFAGSVAACSRSSRTPTSSSASNTRSSSSTWTRCFPR
jgi:lactate dehydrogenase-like 2-hydroxyacid dehydrogenase